MAKFCSNCGSKLEDSAVFCTNCGTATGSLSGGIQGGNDVQNFQNETVQNVNVPGQNVNESAQNVPQGEANTYAQYGYSNAQMNGVEYGIGAGAKKSNAKALIILGAIAAAVIVLIVVLCFTVFGGSYKTPIDNMIKVMEDGDGQAMRKLMPDVQMAYAEKVYSLVDEEGLDKYFDSLAQEEHDNLAEDYGDKFSISYDILSKTKVKASQLMGYEENFAEYGDCEVTDGYTLKIALSIKGSNGEADTDTNSITVIKVDGDWVFADFDSVM